MHSLNRKVTISIPTMRNANLSAIMWSIVDSLCPYGQPRCSFSYGFKLRFLSHTRVWYPWFLGHAVRCSIQTVDVSGFFGKLIGCIPRGAIWHDDVIKWKHFPRYWPFVRGIHRSPVNSPHKGQWHGALMFTLICARINGWVNNREAGDLRRYRAHYDVIVMDHLRTWPWQKNIVFRTIYMLFGGVFFL